MAVIITGLNRIRDLVSTDVDVGVLGTGTAIESRDDTALVAAVTATQMTLTATTANKFLEKVYILSPTTGNGNTYSEFAVFNDAADAMWSRVTFNGIAKTIANRWTIRTRWFFRERNR